MKEFTDLHIHTNLSDGSDTVSQVLELARAHNIAIMAITDHNTLAAYDNGAIEQAKELGIELVAGVELDVIHKGRQYHMLGLGVDTWNGRLREACAYNAGAQEENNLELLRLIAKDEPKASEEGYCRYSIPQGRGGWKLLNYLLDAGITGSLLEGTKYYGRYGFSSNDIRFISLEDAAQTVKSAGGVPLLAHPGEQIAYDQYARSNDSFWEALEELLKAGIEGVECIHPLHGFGLQRELIDLCQKRGMYISGGTDYHGSFFSKQKQTIGGQFVDTETVGRLLERLR